MNPGFLSLILICIAAILLVSGWKPTLLRDIPDAAVVSFFAAWCIAAPLRFHVHNGVEIRGVVIVLALTVAVVALYRRPPLGALHFVSLGLFLASVYYLMKHLGDLNPFLFPGRTWSGATATVAIAAAALMRRTKDQIGGISMALLLGWALYGSVHHERPGALGGLRFQDEWWFAVFVARGCSVAAEHAAAVTRSAAKLLADRRKGVKK